MCRFRYVCLYDLLFVFIVIVSTLQSAPLSFVPIELVQPNGTHLHVFVSGDKFYNWVHDKDNDTIIQDSSSRYDVYAILGKGKLLPSPYIVGRDESKSFGLMPGVNVFPKNVQRQAMAKAAYASLVSKGSQAGGCSNLVIFIRFQSEPEFTEPESSYDSQFNRASGPAGLIKSECRVKKMY